MERVNMLSKTVLATPMAIKPSYPLTLKDSHSLHQIPSPGNAKSGPCT
jgi:hypothetical protein